MNQHKECLAKLCRICGNLLQGRVSYLVKSHAIGIKNLFNTNVEEEYQHPEVFPPSFCHVCYCKIKNFEKGGKVDKSISNWVPHTLPCNTCNWKTLKVRKLGRPPKKKTAAGRPKNTTNMTISDIMQLSPSKKLPSEIDRCISHVVGIKMKQSELANNTIQLGTDGPQVIYFQILLITVTILKSLVHKRNPVNIAKILIFLF